LPCDAKGPGHSGAVLADTPLQCHMKVWVNAYGVADQGGVPIFRKGDRRVCSNYRGSTLLSLNRKVYSRVLVRKLQPIFESQMQEEQYGFRLLFASWNSGPGASCTKGTYAQKKWHRHFFRSTIRCIKSEMTVEMCGASRKLQGFS